jgi:hypothetical protein
MNRTNATRTLLLSLTLAASALVAPAYAQISFSINIAPPTPQYEVVPAIPPGYIWAPGYWGWSGDRHVWVRGRAIAQREGYRWEPDRWDERDHKYYRTAGYWERDSDYRPGKVKKAKKSAHRDNDDRGEGNRGHGNNGNHNGGNKHDG